jgi:hypothetical protein
VVVAVYLPDVTGTASVEVSALRNANVAGAGSGDVQLAPRTHVALTVGVYGIGSDMGPLPELGVPPDVAVPPPDLPLTKRIIFVVPNRTPDFANQTNADSACQAAASAGALPGVYRAIVGFSGANPKNVISLSATTLPIVLPNSVTVSDDSSFWSGSHLAAINATATGAAYTGCVFTHFDAFGSTITTDTKDCVGWTSVLGMDVAQAGDASRSDSQWAVGPQVNCLTMCGLYCIEQ